MKIYCTKNYTQQRLKNKVDKIKHINKREFHRLSMKMKKIDDAI